MNPLTTPHESLTFTPPLGFTAYAAAMRFNDFGQLNSKLYRATVEQAILTSRPAQSPMQPPTLADAKPIREAEPMRANDDPIEPIQQRRSWSFGTWTIEFTWTPEQDKASEIKISNKLHPISEKQSDLLVDFLDSVLKPDYVTISEHIGLHLNETKPL